MGDLNRQIEHARVRIATLQERAPALTSDEADVVRPVFEELRSTLEELQIADAELRRQNTELAEARLRLDAERRRYRELFELAPDGYLVTDGEGVVLEANRAAGELLGTPPRFLVGKPLLLFMPAAEHQRFHAALTSLGGEGGVSLARDGSGPERLTWELPMQPRSGEPFQASISLLPVRRRGRGTVAVRWLIRDVTEQHLSEDRIRGLNVELERRVAERTDDLRAANLKLGELLVREREARDAAEEASRAKDQFLATVSHELRTPLNSMSGWIYLLRSERIDEGLAAHALDIIQSNVRSLAQLIEDLLDVSRIVAGKLDLDLRPVDLARAVEAALDAVRPAAAARAIEIRTDLQIPSLTVMGDHVRLQQVAWNLLSNAIKFSAEGGAVDVRVARRGIPGDGSGTRAEIEVRDRGCGIRSDFLPFVFDRFRQGDASTVRVHGGLGLGLAIVRHLVELHGGTVEASSSGEGQGATFTVSLPVAPEPSSDAATRPMAPPPEAA